MYLQRFITHYLTFSLPFKPAAPTKCISEENIATIAGWKTCDNLLNSCRTSLITTVLLVLKHMVCFFTAFSACLSVCLTVLCEQQSECNQHSKTRWGLASCCYQCGKQWLINYVCGRHRAHYDSGKLSVTFSDRSHVHGEYGHAFWQKKWCEHHQSVLH